MSFFEFLRGWRGGVCKLGSLVCERVVNILWASQNFVSDGDHIVFGSELSEVLLAFPLASYNEFN